MFKLDLCFLKIGAGENSSSSNVQKLFDKTEGTTETMLIRKVLFVPHFSNTGR